MKKHKLGINTGFAVNRYAEPEEWTRVIYSSGAKYVQFTADVLNVSLPGGIISQQTSRITRACDRFGLEISSTFTGAFTRVNHLAHPEREIQDYWVNWFKRFADLSIALNSRVMGSHFGILTHRDNTDPETRLERIKQNIDNWHRVAEYAAVVGIEKIIWEPMSISRELGETIEQCLWLNALVNENAPLPFQICLDVDHGDVMSKNAADTDPYAWLEAVGKDAPVIHLKQSSSNKSGHWPFTPEHNEHGSIKADEFMKSVVKHCGDDVDLVLECSFREREPTDSAVEDALRQSVEYWRPFIPN